MRTPLHFRRQRWKCFVIFQLKVIWKFKTLAMFTLNHNFTAYFYFSDTCKSLQHDFLQQRSYRNYKKAVLHTREVAHSYTGNSSDKCSNSYLQQYFFTIVTAAVFGYNRIFKLLQSAQIFVKNGGTKGVLVLETLPRLPPLWFKSRKN